MCVLIRKIFCCSGLGVVSGRHTSIGCHSNAYDPKCIASILPLSLTLFLWCSRLLVLTVSKSSGSFSNIKIHMMYAIIVFVVVLFAQSIPCNVLNVTSRSLNKRETSLCLCVCNFVVLCSPLYFRFNSVFVFPTALCALPRSTELLLNSIQCSV